MLTADMVWRGCWICTDRFQTDNCLYLCSPPGSYRTYYWVWSLNSRLNELTVVSRGCWRPVWSGVQAWFFCPTLLLLLLAPSSPSFPFSISLLLHLVLSPSLSIAAFPTCCSFLFLCFCFLLSPSALTLSSSFLPCYVTDLHWLSLSPSPPCCVTDFFWGKVIKC